MSCWTKTSMRLPSGVKGQEVGTRQAIKEESPSDTRLPILNSRPVPPVLTGWSRRGNAAGNCSRNPRFRIFADRRTWANDPHNRTPLPAPLGLRQSHVALGCFCHLPFAQKGRSDGASPEETRGEAPSFWNLREARANSGLSRQARRAKAPAPTCDCSALREGKGRYTLRRTS